MTSKNHDLKSAVGRNGHADDWMFALITLQTMEGFLGAGNYGISRMNGGLGSRPAVSLAPMGGLGAHVRRDMNILAENRSAMLSEFPLSDTGQMLLWAVPWNGTKGEALMFDQLDPFYIEVCRRVRLRRDTGRISAIRATSKGTRIAAKDLKGRTGDPWTPIQADKSLTLGPGGFTYKRVREYLASPKWKRPILLTPTGGREGYG